MEEKTQDTKTKINPDVNQEKEKTFFEKIGMIFAHPKKFFEYIKDEKGIGKSITLYLSTLLFLIAARFTMALGMRMDYSFYSLYSFGPTIIFPIIGLFIAATIIHIFLLLLGVGKSYADTCRVITYSLVPALIISAIPMVGFLSIFFSIWLSIIGLSIVHETSKGKIALAVLLPIFIFFGIIFYFLFGALGFTFRF
jgi:hypothetical protein